MVAYGKDGGDEIDEITRVTSRKFVGIYEFTFQARPVRWLLLALELLLSQW